MADAILGPTIQVLLEKVLSLVAIGRVGSLPGFKKDLEKLERSAEMIQAVLADAEVKQTGSQAVRLWLKRLKSVSFDADIVLDELNYEFLRRKIKSRNQLQGKVCSLFYFSKDDISFRWRMVSKVRDINIKLNNINQEATDFGLVKMERLLLPAATGVASSRQTDSVVTSDVVGRDKDESKIVEILLSPSEKVVSVLPIIGMGGLGKTTLAKSVYNNPQIHGHFSKKIWVCVSEKFEVIELFKLILGSLTRNRVELQSRDDVVQEIRKELEGKTYLLVLDDVWNEIAELWDAFFDSLVGISTAHGSKCLVTTRLQRVASIVSPHRPPYVLGKLSDDECWSILKGKVVQSWEIPEELILIREDVIKRCDGLPLAANVIGGLLLLQRKEKWRLIVENMLWNFSEVPENDRIMQTLKLSFDYLPYPSIKKCFAYFSLFSKDAMIDRNLLIELWMAEGFLQTDLQNKMTMEEIGDRYLDILERSSLLENVERRNIYYKMHDLVHDLTQSLSKLQRFDSENYAINKCAYQVRCLVLDSSAEIMSLNDTLALILKSSSISNEMLVKFKNLHTLNLSNAEIVDIPSSIGKLKHLRFLDISHSQIEGLPESICKLYNLQTLRMDDCYNIGVLPRGMNNLISLRHLHHFSWYAELKMPLKMGRLTSLQTLEFFNVGDELGRHIDELGPLKLLKGKLQIRNLELVKGKEGAQLADLSGKQNLRELKFSWSSSVIRDAVGISNDENVLDGLKPHENLELLTVENFKGSRLPHWLANLSKLLKLELKDCKNCRELPPLGHLPSLENLVLEMENVSCIGASFYGLDDSRGGGGLGSSSSFGDGQAALSRKKLFPVLKNLYLKSMKSLVEWEEAAVLNNDVVVFPGLEDLTIESGSLISAPTHFPSLKRLEIRGNVQPLAAKNILSKVISTLESLTFNGLDGLTGLCDLHVGPTGTVNSHFTSLKEFRVIACKGLVSIASETLEECTSLSDLELSDCPNLISFPIDLQQTPSLSTIYVEKCPKLFTDKNSMPRGFGHLTSLRDLSIGPFSTDDCSMELFDWSGLNSCSSTLRYLTLYGLPHLESLLPDEFQHFIALQELSLDGLGSIEALPDWLGNLAALEKLWLWNCEKLGYLPSISALRRLTKLRYLCIINCLLLQERCNSNSNPNSEWSKISQLPNLMIMM